MEHLYVGHPAFRYRHQCGDGSICHRDAIDGEKVVEVTLIEEVVGAVDDDFGHGVSF